MDDCRLLQKHSKVKIVSSARFTKPGMGIVNCFYILIHHLLPSRPPNLTQNGQFGGYSCPNHMCNWLKTAAGSFSSQKCFTSKDYIQSLGWDLYMAFKVNHDISAKLTPILAKNEQLQGWFGPNDMCKWLQIAAKALQSRNWFISKVYKVWDGNHTFIQKYHLLSSRTPTLAKNDQFRAYSSPNHIWTLL